MPVVVDESVDPERQRAIRDTANERLRKYARRVGADVDRIARTAGVIRDGLVNDIGPTPGFRQPRRARGGWVSQDELTESLRNQADRLAAGGE